MDSIFTEDERTSAEFNALDDEEHTHGHGTWISDILRWGAPEAEIFCYRIVDENGEYSRFDLLKAFDELKSGDADIVNLSLGNHKSNCSGNCRECRAAGQLIDAGLIVIAASGNAKQNGGICCPSKHSRVMSVGGFQDLCGFEPHFANRAIWIQNPDPEPDEEAYTNTICSHRGCSEKMRTCKRNERVEWEGNVPFSRIKPDSLAPVHYTKFVDDTVYLDPGTSFSSAYVVGGLAKMFSAMDYSNWPEPGELKKAIQNIPETSEQSIPYFDISFIKSQFI